MDSFTLIRIRNVNQERSKNTQNPTESRGDLEVATLLNKRFETGDGDAPHTAFLVQIGPVQEAIAQARSCHDLWSGSFLLSWNVARTIERLLARNATIVFPTDARQLDLLKVWRSTNQLSDLDRSRALIPNIPNRILGVGDSTIDWSEAIQQSINDVFDYGRPDHAESQRSHWRRICDACWDYFIEKGAPLGAEYRERWDAQLNSFWQANWAIWPMDSADHALKHFSKLPASENLHAPISAPSKELWSAHYQALAHHLDARRQTRDFNGWLDGTSAEVSLTRQKDFFSGKEEAILTDKWFEALRKEDGPEGREEIQHQFRRDDALGAVNLVKRVWRRAYLLKLRGADPNDKKEGERQFDKHDFGMPSVPGIAAFPWAKHIYTKHKNEKAFQDFCELLGHDGVQRLVDNQIAKLRKNESLGAWIRRVDWEVFQDRFWQDLQKKQDSQNQTVIHLSESDTRQIETVRENLKDLGLRDRPGSYIGVIAFDGDGMGRWLNGSKLKGKPFTIDFHMRFSRALSEFSRDVVKRLVEHGWDEPATAESKLSAFDGKLIYAGGDDVLAILPATQAIACAKALRDLFQRTMRAHTKELFENLGISVGEDAFSGSAGIAIGHMRAPLQDLIEEARIAEGEAKQIERAGPNDPNQILKGDAFSVRLYKRAGEIIQWGAPFNSKLYNLYESFHGPEARPDQWIYRKPFESKTRPSPISGRFPHRVSELLIPYGDASLDKAPELVGIALKEIQWALRQHTQKSPVPFSNDAFLLECEDALNELRVRKRPLSDFYNLFNLEAFLAKHEES